MSDQAGGALALEDVTRRFAESEETLSKARERLQGLIQAEETTAASAASLREAAGAVGEFVRRANGLLAELEQAQKQTREVLAAGARFLDGTELKELKEAVETHTKNVADRLAALEERYVDVDAANARAHAAEAELARIKGALPGRQRKKLGLE
jgi:hypothetical protein